MTCNQDMHSSSEHELGVLSPDANGPAGLSGLLSVLNHPNNRRIVFRLLKQDKPMLIDALTARAVSDTPSLATDETARVGERNEEGSKL